MKLVKNYSINIFALLLGTCPLLAQDTLSVPPAESVFIQDGPPAKIQPFSAYPFLDLEENRIHNSVSLSEFYEKLYRLKKGENFKVQIIQVGDSHIQADYLTRAVRQKFQEDFGNAGRGFVFPFRVARTNEPANFFTSSAIHWDVKRCVSPELPLPIGIGGITIRTALPTANFALKTFNSPTQDYSFNRITLFFQKDVTSFNVVVKDSLNEDIAFLGSYTFEPYPNTSTVLLPFSTHQLTFQMLASTSTQTQATLFGVNLENGKPGVVYHAIGVNGAKVKNFVDASLFAEQTAALAPDLFIFSFGTNEALDYPYVDPQLYYYFDTLIGRIKQKNPNAKFLISTLPDSYRRKVKRNTGVEIIRKKIIDYAELRNLAYWDLYQVGGGKHSADEWRKNRLLRSDGIHFFVAGYELQGNLLYDALMKGYDEYVQYRHP